MILILFLLTKSFLKLTFFDSLRSKKGGMENGARFLNPEHPFSYCNLILSKFSGHIELHPMLNRKTAISYAHSLLLSTSDRIIELI